MRVLIFDRSAEGIAEPLPRLRKAGFAVDVATDAGDASATLERHDHVCFVLVLDDAQEPDGDGLDLVRAQRAGGWETPILVISARDVLEDRLVAFAAGVDDVLVRPYVVEELVARVVALSRRAPSGGTAAPVRVGDLELDAARREVRRGTRRILLRPKEVELLAALLRAGGAVVTRRELVEQCWDVFHDPRSNIVDTHMAALRRRLGDPDPIETVRGVGYRLRDQREG